MSNTLRLLGLDEPTQSLVGEGTISARQALAILPALDVLEQDALDHAASLGYTPGQLVDRAKAGASSDSLRQHADHFVLAATRSLNPLHGMPFPTDHAFVGDDSIVEVFCDDCTKVRHKKTVRCPSPACWEIKAEKWADERLALASLALGIPPAGDAEEYAYLQENQFYSVDKAHVEALIEKGCDNLRLRFSLDPSAYHPPGWDDVIVVCHHGPGSKFCKCLAQRKAVQTAGDPGHRERSATEKTILDRVQTPSAQALAMALSMGHAPAWRALLYALMPSLNTKGTDWTLAQVQEKVAMWIVRQWTLYASTPEEALRIAGEKLHAADLPAPWGNSHEA